MREFEVFRFEPVLCPAHANGNVITTHPVLDLCKFLGKTFVCLQRASVEYEVHASYQIKFVLGPEDVCSKLVNVH